MGIVPATTHAARFLPYAAVLDDAGVDVERALSRAQFPSNILYEPDTVIPSRSIAMFVARIARKEGIDDVFLRGAMKENFDSLEPWLKARFLGAATLGELLMRYCVVGRKYNTYHNYHVNCDARLARICCALPIGAKAESWHIMSEWSNASLFREMIRYVLGETYEPTAITLQAKAPLTPAMQQAMGTTRLLQGWTSTSVVFPKHLLATPLPNLSPPITTPELNKADPIDDYSFPSVMRDLIKPCLSESWLDIEAAAAMAGSSIRTFQRRLSDFDLTYKQLLEQTRMEVARSRLVDQQDSILDIGFEVGYTDPSNFTRAFRRAHGVTPKDYRHTCLQPDQDRNNLTLARNDQNHSPT